MTITLSSPLLFGIGAAIVTMYVLIASLISSNGDNPVVGVIVSMVVQIVMFLLAYGFVSFMEIM